MKYSAILAVCFLIVGLPAIAHGQEVPTPPDVPPGRDRIEIIHIGDRSPVQGMVFDTDTSIRWTNKLRWWPETYRLHLQADLESQAAVQRSHNAELSILTNSYTREIQGLRNDIRSQAAQYETALAQLRTSPPFYKTWWFAFGMGVLVSSVLTGVVIGLILSL